MPSDEPVKDKDRSETMKSSTANKPMRSSQSRSDNFSDSTPAAAKQTKNHKHLFTVKPGGIAGYLGTIVLPSGHMSSDIRNMQHPSLELPRMWIFGQKQIHMLVFCRFMHWSDC